MVLWSISNTNTKQEFPSHPTEHQGLRHLRMPKPKGMYTIASEPQVQRLYHKDQKPTRNRPTPPRRKTECTTISQSSSKRNRLGPNEASICHQSSPPCGAIRSHRIHRDCYQRENTVCLTDHHLVPFQNKQQRSYGPSKRRVDVVKLKVTVKPMS